MVANIRSGSSPGGALYYNKEKVDKDEAEVLFWQKMLEPFDKHGDVYKRQALRHRAADPQRRRSGADLCGFDGYGNLGTVDFQ